MILFVFEGQEREPNLYKTMEKLYFPRGNNNIVCSFGNNIYALYKELQSFDGDGDIVSVMKEKLAERGDEMLANVKSSDFSEIYLFFDYDFQHEHLSLDEINRRMKEMLELFDEETNNGKLYINYPMIESIRYTKELPDDNYLNYVVSRVDCHDFKHLANDFSFYGNLDYILFKDGEVPDKEKYSKIFDNWQYLKNMNVSKANHIICGKYEMPVNKRDINQLSIFESQKQKFIDVNETVAILNSFPIFIYDYLK